VDILITGSRPGHATGMIGGVNDQKKGKRRCDTLPVLFPDAAEIVKVQGWSGIDRAVVRIEPGRRTPGPFATGPASR
jgi:hypothetical protein